MPHCLQFWIMSEAIATPHQILPASHRLLTAGHCWSPLNFPAHQQTSLIWHWKRHALYTPMLRSLPAHYAVGGVCRNANTDDSVDTASTVALKAEGAKSYDCCYTRDLEWLSRPSKGRSRHQIQERAQLGHYVSKTPEAPSECPESHSRRS